MTIPVVCQAMTTSTAHSASVGSASHVSERLHAEPAENALSGPLKSKMNFQMYDTASGLSTTGMKNSTRSTYRVFSVRFSARASSRPMTLVAIRKPKARNSVFSQRPDHGRVVEDPLEVVQADEVEVADPGPVGEGVERAARRGDVVDEHHQRRSRGAPTTSGRSG